MLRLLLLTLVVACAGPEEGTRARPSDPGTSAPELPAAGSAEGSVLEAEGSVLEAEGSAEPIGAAPKPLEAQATPAGSVNPDPAPSLSWSEVLERDDRVSFPATGEQRALAALERPGQAADRRSAALMALGCAGARTQRPLLSSWSVEGSPAERCAAILALGELADGVVESLAPLTEESAEIAECALLALLRSGSESGSSRVERIAADASHPRAQGARALMAYVTQPHSSAPLPAVRRLLALRWEAAKRFGLIDGEPWSISLARELISDQSFLDDVVLRGAARLRRSGIRDHMLASLTRGSGPGRLRSALHVMRAELVLLIQNEIWVPRGDAEWAVLLDEIARERLEAFTSELLVEALEIESVRFQAAGLLARAGEPAFLDSMYFDPYLDPERKSVDERIQACEIWGGTRNDRWIEELDSLRDDPVLEVRAAALVAQARLGATEAQEQLRAAFRKAEETEEDQSSEPAPVGEAERAVLLAALLRTGCDGATVQIVEDLLPGLDEKARAGVAAALVMQGRPSHAALLRRTLSDNPESVPLDVNIVRSLGFLGSERDIEILRERFPVVGQQRELNVELALALMQAGDPLVMRLARAALWQGPWDRSILAAALIVEHQSLLTLIHEVRNPPATSGRKALRRIGFAIGEWGGFGALEDLERELRSGSMASGNAVMQGAFLGVLSTRTH